MKNTAVVLKEKHSLIGRGILPVVMELKVGPPSPPIAKLIEHKLEELIQELKRLTGEELTNVLTLAGGPINSENEIFALHLAIILQASYKQL